MWYVYLVRRRKLKLQLWPYENEQTHKHYASNVFGSKRASSIRLETRGKRLEMNTLS